MQQKHTFDKQIKKFNVQNNNLQKQVALHHIVFIRSLHHNGSNNPDHNILNFTKFYYNLLQVKQNLISSSKTFVYKLPDELTNELRHNI